MELFLTALLCIETVLFAIIFLIQRKSNITKIILIKQQMYEELESFKKDFSTNQTDKIRKETLKKSERVARGFTVENFAPFLQKTYSPTDFRHLGNPIDYIIYDGLTDVHQGVSDEIKEIILLDIKTGDSRLNKVQRRIKEAVESGRVSFKTYNPDKEDI